MIRKTSRRVLSGSLGRKVGKTWWWNNEVLECIQRKVSKKQWDTEKTKGSRQEYKEMQHKAKIEVEKVKQSNCESGVAEKYDKSPRWRCE